MADPGRFFEMSDDSERVIKPGFHHVNIKTTRLQEMIDWYVTVVGAEVNFRFPGGAFLSNDRANHRIALLTVPGLLEHPEKIRHTGLHHTAFEYEGFDDLMSSYARLKKAGIEPQVCLDHGLTTSLYYADPDRNLVELQVDNFADWALSTEWMRTSEDFRQDPIGTFFDPDLVLAAHRAGTPLEQLHKDTRAGKYPSSKPPMLNLPPMA
jgi:catechol 2,3-dioxygenase